MPGGQQTQLRKPAHPMAGFVVAVRIPQPQEATEPAMVQVGPFRVVEFGRMEAGLVGGVVIEIGHPPLTDMADEVLIPYSEGCAIFYAQGQAIELGDYDYVPMTNILAWEPAP